MLYPPKGRAKRTQWGPLDSLSILYVIEKPKLNFQKHERGSAFFETSKTFIVRMGGWVDKSGLKSCLRQLDQKLWAI